jgi:hypothetical protein
VGTEPYISVNVILWLKINLVRRCRTPVEKSLRPWIKQIEGNGNMTVSVSIAVYLASLLPRVTVHTYNSIQWEASPVSPLNCHWLFSIHVRRFFPQLLLLLFNLIYSACFWECKAWFARHLVAAKRFYVSLCLLNNSPLSSKVVLHYVRIYQHSQDTINYALNCM